MNYKKITSIRYVGSSKTCTFETRQKIVDGAKRASKEKLELMISKSDPRFFYKNKMHIPNDNGYYKSKSHFIVAISNVEYFFKYNIKQ